MRACSKSPVREYCTPGSVAGRSGNWPFYADVWNFVRNPNTADWSLTAKPGFLRLNGSAVSFKEKKSPAFICRRQTAFNIIASAKIDFTPTSKNEEAGLVVYGNDKNHYDFLITAHESRRSIMLRHYLQDEEGETTYKEIANGEIVLKIVATELEYRFYIREGENAFELIGTALPKNLSTEVINGFTGVFIGMYASGNIAPNALPADFDWFEFIDEEADTTTTVLRRHDFNNKHSGGFNPETAAGFESTSASGTTLEIFDFLGRKVTTVVNRELPAGNRRIPLNALKVSRGIYFSRLNAGSAGDDIIFLH